MEPPATPPRHSGNLPKNPMTPEQIRRMEESRLRAKALRAQQLAAVKTTSNDNPLEYKPGDKRPANVISSDDSAQRDPRQAFTSAKAQENGIQPAKKFQKYVEYDFSKMTDTKGGFLSQTDDPFNKALHNDKAGDKDIPGDMTLKQWEQQQLLRRMRDAKAGPFEPGITGFDRDQKKCRECRSLEIDFKWVEAFDCEVCNACKEKYPDKYSLLTKTEAREDYLLTEPELKDEQLLKHMDRPNPHKSTFHPMMLYLRYQIEEYAFSDKKWGSAKALDAEFEKRQGETKRRKVTKFKNRLADLKRRTRVEAYRRQKAGMEGGEFGDKITGGKHEHEWGRPVDNPETGLSVKTCIECGMEVEELEF